MWWLDFDTVTFLPPQTAPLGFSMQRGSPSHEMVLLPLSPCLPVCLPTCPLLSPCLCWLTRNLSQLVSPRPSPHICLLVRLSTHLPLCWCLLTLGWFGLTPWTLAGRLRGSRLRPSRLRPTRLRPAGLRPAGLRPAGVWAARLRPAGLRAARLWPARAVGRWHARLGQKSWLSGFPSSALSHPLFLGRVPPLEQTAEKKGYPYSSLSTGGPSYATCCKIQAAPLQLKLGQSSDASKPETATAFCKSMQTIIQDPCPRATSAGGRGRKQVILPFEGAQGVS